MIITTVPTYTATIYVGLQPGYNPPIHTLEELEAICQEVCNKGGLCVTITPLRFVYKNGAEPGAAIGLINYPRFPITSDDLRSRALELAKLVKVAMGQYRVSVVFPNETVMLEDEK